MIWYYNKECYFETFHLVTGKHQVGYGWFTISCALNILFEKTGFWLGWGLVSTCDPLY